MLGKESTIAIIIGILLIIVGVLGQVLTGTSSITALIPAFFGLPIILLGLVARTPQRTKVSMHIVAVLALLGVVGTVNVLPDLSALLTSGEASNISASVLSRGSMFLLCGIMLIVSIISFIQARRNRRKEETV